MYHQVDDIWEMRESETFGRDLEAEQKDVVGNKRVQDSRGIDGKVWLSDHEGLRTVFSRVSKS